MGYTTMSSYNALLIDSGPVDYILPTMKNEDRKKRERLLKP